MLKLIRWIFGYIIFTIEGKNSLNFINSSSKSGINLWDITKIDKILFARSASSEYENLLKTAKLNNLKLKIIERRGFPFFCLERKNRKGLAVGLILFLLIIQILSLYIWNINVNDLKNINKNEIISAAEKFGIRKGTLKKTIDAQLVNQKIMSEIPDIAWISVNIDGCGANISVKEKIETPEIISSESLPRAMKASKDGQVVHIETYKGNPVISAGDAVITGQILINSDSNIPNDEKACADGKVWAKTFYNITERVSLKKTIKEKTGKENQIYKLWLLGKEIPINFWVKPNENWEKSEINNFFKIKNFEIPFSFKKEIYTEINEVQIQITPEEALSCAESLAKSKLFEEINNKEVLSQEYETKLENDEAFFIIHLRCMENIAVPENS
ncbi:MAG: sporulation protein YqfD [Oscillospiraceae bacterium]|nr:sporulation protein YqfD [Oscillospiraceae bacterium]